MAVPSTYGVSQILQVSPLSSMCDKRWLVRGGLNMPSPLEHRNIEQDQRIYKSDDVRCHD